MIYKLVGTILVLFGCGWVGFSIAARHRSQEYALRQLISVLDYMECELQYHLTPLPALCRQAASECRGGLQQVFLELTKQLEDQLEGDVGRCMDIVLANVQDVPSQARTALSTLGNSLGRFDISGQLKGLEAVRAECRRMLSELGTNRESRLRSYQTLGLCAGAALAILFI